MRKTQAVANSDVDVQNCADVPYRGATPRAHTVTYVYDSFGLLAAEYSSSPITAPCGTCYLAGDHLGSMRLLTDATSNATVLAAHDFAPFGLEIQSGVGGRGTPWGVSDNVSQKFTGQERDTETGLDFFQARYMASGLARFLSPDPGNAGADTADPQSWNGYGYVGGQPLVYTDPSGEDFGGFLNWLGGLFGFRSSATDNCCFFSFGSAPPPPTDVGSSSGGPSQEGPPEVYNTGTIFRTNVYYLQPVSTPPTAGLRPCANVDPATLDYVTPRLYYSEGRTVSPAQHIIEGHLFPNADPGNTYYISGNTATGVDDPRVIWNHVKAWNAQTFKFGMPASINRKTGSIKFKLNYPQVSIGPFIRFGIGVDKFPTAFPSNGNWLTFNNFVVESNCKSVVTSYPSAN